ncbi:ribosome small subunit-dependent GTPase A [Selenomonas flueggei]|uniref:Small ribosomal subunit biogenesis GTPase RsgA n=1 Tax=Selenomonas flueggei ATCC 43531 TaxID=638302 RepID=C4V0Q2_9FIRM|nr:ribosome small subunit-dependent GTPase A [Selenomonas flueggei]EEQ49581.1 ribosome small subunit-dependent GTPase A [Selenomonas flueggei ATCC 43531]
MHQYGRILKVYNSVIHVSVNSAEILCKLRGKSTRGRDALLPGDIVRLERISSTEGVIEGTEPRTSLLLRPRVANLTQIVVTVAAAAPNPHPLVVSRFLVLAEHSGIDHIVLCINKIDLAGGNMTEFCTPYEAAGYPVLLVSAVNGTGLSALQERLAGEITVFAGPSGAGKSSLLNAMDSSLALAVGAVSEKIGRGRHTTRRAELLPFAGGYVVDTPGFTQQELTGIAADELADCFPEFLHFPGCRFTPCSHSHEPNCAVKAAAEEGRLACTRYDAYIALLDEIRSVRR